MPAPVPATPIYTPVSQDSSVLKIENQFPPMKAPVAIKTTTAPDKIPAVIQNAEPADAIQGFGNQVPLVLALQQIVPTNYRYSFQPPINPGQRISWKGGKPWKDVIADIARSNNMNVDIISNVVAFRAQASTPPMAMPMDQGMNAVPVMPAALPVIPTTQVKSISSPIVNSPLSQAELPAPMVLKPADKKIETADFDAPLPMAPVQPAPVAAPKDEIVFDAPASKIKTDELPAPMDLKAGAVKTETIMPSTPAVEKTIAATSKTTKTFSDQNGTIVTTSASKTTEKAPDVLAPPTEKLFQDIPPEAEKNTESPKAANFDNLMDSGAPVVKKTVKDKTITTATEEKTTTTPLKNKYADLELPAGASFMTVPSGVADPVKGETSKKIVTQKTTTQTTSLLKPIDPVSPKAEEKPKVSDPLDNLGKNDDQPKQKLPEKSLKDQVISSSQLPATAVPVPPVATQEMASVTTASSGVDIKSDLGTARDWEAHKDETMRQTLTRWSQEANVSLVWSSEYDYPLQTGLRIHGNYADAVRTLLAGFSKAQPRPLGRFFKNQQVGAQPVLIVETQRFD